MIKIVLPLLVLILSTATFYSWRKIKVIMEERAVESIIQRLNQAEYKVAKNLVLAGSFIDYLVISTAGIFVIKKCSFRKSNSFLIGDEGERVWNYYEPYSKNPKGPSIDALQGIAVENANKIPFSNPVMECERAIKALQPNLGNQLYPIKFRPIILLLPKLKGVNIHRTKDSRAKIIFANTLEETLLAQEVIQIPVMELGIIRDKILNSARIRRAG